jgi:hypothetical protein
MAGTESFSQRMVRALIGQQRRRIDDITQIESDRQSRGDRNK